MTPEERQSKMRQLQEALDSLSDALEQAKRVAGELNLPFTFGGKTYFPPPSPRLGEVDTAGIPTPAAEADWDTSTDEWESSEKCW